MKHYIVSSKGDDYGGCRTELVQTTQEFANQYYFQKVVPPEHVEILKNYFDFLDFEEESERDDSQRYYGN